MTTLKLTPRQREVAAALRGKTIAHVAMYPFGPENGGGVGVDPIITFTDGSSLAFLVQESETGQYGVDLILRVKS